MARDIRRSIVALLALTVLLGGAYPVIVWGISQVVFKHQADGSLIVRNGRVVGSSLLAQGFKSNRYFHPRPSAADYNASASAASNLGPNSQDLANGVKQRLADVAKTDRIAPSLVPVDLVTASGSGLDPDISRDGALIQVDRVARARRLEPAKVRALVLSKLDSPTAGLLGTTRVNVLDLNLALDALGQ